MFTFKTTLAGGLAAAGVLAALVAASAGQAGSGTPITTCGQVVTTDAYLTKNLLCTGHGIVVGANGITIDLKGFAVDGDRGGFDHGVENSVGYDHVTVKNGVLRNFGYGIVASSGADYLSVVGVLATGNVVAGIHIYGQWPSVDSTVASANNQNGMEIQGYGPKITSSTVTGNHLNGITITGNAAVVASSQVTGNDGNGIYVFGGNAKVKQSTATGNGGYGIWVQGDSAVIKGNQAPGNGFQNGVADGDGRGIFVNSFAAVYPPTGSGNYSRGDDDVFYSCMPSTLC